MIEQERKLDRLKQLLSLLNDSIDKESFTAAFKLLMDFVVRLEKTLTAKIDSKTDGAKEELEALKRLYKEAIGRLEKDNASTLSNLKRWALERVGELFIKSKINERLAEVDDRLANLKDGVEGPVGPPGVPGEAGSPDTAIMVRDKLETLEGEERLDIEAIRGITVSKNAPINPKEKDLWVEVI